VDHALVLYRIGTVRESMGDLKLALLLLEEAAKVLERCPVPTDTLRVRVLRRMASIHSKRRDLQAGREAAEAALELAKRLTDRRALAEAYWEAALVEERRRDFTRATEYAQRARDLLSELGDQQETAVLLGDLGAIKGHMGKPAEAVQHYEDGLDILRSVDDPITRAALLNGLAGARLNLSDPEAALASAAKSLAIMEGRDPGSNPIAGAAHVLRAKAFLQEGKLAESREELAEAKRVTEAVEDGGLGEILIVEGDLLLAEGKPEEAAHTFRRSYELAMLAPR
jgi:tetratricopeptide (TPR) repeat protein